MAFSLRSATSIRFNCVLQPQSSRAYATDLRNRGVFRCLKDAKFVDAANSPERIPRLNGLPEVIVTGCANCGKSSLLNAVLGRRSLLETSKKAGRTRALNFYHVGPEVGGLMLVDAPGYGARGRPEWGKLFDKYLETREELKRVYILFNAKHPINSYDTMMLSHLSEILISQRERFTLQAVITKIDCVRLDDVEGVIKRIREDIKKIAPLCLPPIVTSSKMQPPFGIEEVRKNIEQACDLPP